jgi:hypothetical protein
MSRVRRTTVIYTSTNRGYLGICRPVRHLLGDQCRNDRADHFGAGDS